MIPSQKLGNGLADHGHRHGGSVDRRPAIERRYDSDGDRREDRDEHGEQGELDRRREALQDHVDGGDPIGEGGSEITLGEPLDVGGVLDVERLVEAELDPRLLDFLLARALAHIEVGRVSAHMQRDEADHRHAKHHDDALRQSTGNESPHALSAFLWIDVGAFGPGRKPTGPGPTVLLQLGVREIDAFVTARLPFQAF